MVHAEASRCSRPLLMRSAEGRTLCCSVHGIPGRLAHPPERMLAVVEERGLRRARGVDKWRPAARQSPPRDATWGRETRGLPEGRVCAAHSMTNARNASGSPKAQRRRLPTGPSTPTYCPDSRVRYARLGAYWPCSKTPSRLRVVRTTNRSRPIRRRSERT